MFVEITTDYNESFYVNPKYILYVMKGSAPTSAKIAFRDNQFLDIPGISHQKVVDIINEEDSNE